jgi:protein-disulfide isomerase
VARARIRRTALGALGAAVVACLAAAPGPALPLPGPAEARVLAEVDGEAITAGALDRALGPRTYTSDEQRYQLQRQKLDELIAEHLLRREASRRGMPLSRLLDEEVRATVRVTDQEVAAFYREHKDSVQAPEAVAWTALKKYLEQQRFAEGKRRLVERLKTRAQVRVHLRPPNPRPNDYLVVPRAPRRGPERAPVTIVEFSDMRCPFCARAQPVLERVLEAYPAEVRLVHRHFPGAGHAQARPAAEAAECAGEQGKFWQYRARLFAQASDLGPARLRAIAQDLRLDGPAFASCLGDGRSGARVSEDVAAGREAGVTGTPTFFVNGRLLEGAQPFAAFKRMIDQELALRGSSRGGSQR